MWKSGIYKAAVDYSADELESLPLPPDNLIQEKNIWLETVRKVASVTNIIHDEPEPISIYFRWGQLNDNDYCEVQDHLEQFTSSDEGLISFIDCYHEGKGIQGVEKLVKHIPTFISRIESLVDIPANGKRIITYLNAIESGETPPD